MSQSKAWDSLPAVIKFARLLSVLLVAAYILYIFFASAMILGAGEELFPKMVFSFLTLAALAVAVASTWRWQVAGSLASMAAWLAYRYAEFLRLGYWPEMGIFSYGVIVLVLIYFLSALLMRFSPTKPK